MDFCINRSSRHESCSVNHFLGPSSALQIFEEILSPIRSKIPSFKNSILVALDTEEVSDSTRIRELGVAMLDTNQLLQYHPNDKKDDGHVLQQLIQTRMLSLGKSRRSKKAQRFWPIRFLFGETKEMQDVPKATQDINVRNLIEKIFTSVSRPIVLIGHSIKTDCQKIHLNYGIDLRILPNVIAIVDTARIASSVNDFVVKNISLYDTCLSCGIMPEQLHNAGNDAVYTLRTTLLLFKRYKEEELFYEALSGFEHPDPKTILLWEYQLDKLGRLGRAHETIVTQHLQYMREKAEEIKKARRRGHKNVKQDALTVDSDQSESSSSPSSQTVWLEV